MSHLQLSALAMSLASSVRPSAASRNAAKQRRDDADEKTAQAAAVFTRSEPASSAAVSAADDGEVVEDSGHVDKKLKSSGLLLASVSSSPPLAAAGHPLSAYRLQWQRVGTLHVFDSHPASTVKIPGNERIAGFDMDCTLIVPKSGSRYPTDRHDWRWLHPAVPVRLRQLWSEGWKVVIFTNQGGLGSGLMPVLSITGKIHDMVQELGFPVQAFAAARDDRYRKPGIGMWTRFLQQHNAGVRPDLSVSFYVGDSAGRVHGWDGSASTARDHSLADRNFALRIGLRFATPEPFFLGHQEAPYQQDTTITQFFAKVTKEASTAAAAVVVERTSSSVLSSACEEDEVVVVSSSRTVKSVISVSPSPSPSSSPARALPAASSVASSSSAPSSSSATASSSPPLHAKAHQELVLFVGCPAAGKSSFARAHFIPHRYAHVNLDTLKSKEACLRRTAAALAAGQSVVVDNTNPSPDTRALYVAAAARRRVPVRCFVFSTDLPTARRLNAYRETASGGAYKQIPPIAYSQYSKRFVAPDIKEGFAEIVTVPFVPSFASDADKQTFEGKKRC